jgi:hypothetical protein
MELAQVESLYIMQNIDRSGSTLGHKKSILNFCQVCVVK